MRRFSTICATTGLLGVLLGDPAIARADQAEDAERAAARDLGTAGVEALQKHDYQTASEKLERAYLVRRVPSLGLWSARALVGLGRLVKASERYREVTELEVTNGDLNIQKQAQADAATELAALLPRIPSLVVQVEGVAASDVVLSVDGAKLSMGLVGEHYPMDPGQHVVEGRGPQGHAATQFTMAEGESQVVVLHFGASVSAGPSQPTTGNTTPKPSSDAATTSAGSLQRPLAWAALGVGTAGIILGGVTGILAIGKKSDIDGNAQCHDNQCAPSQQSLVDSYSSLRTISSVGFIAGAMVAGTGVVLLLTTPSEEPAPSVALWVLPNAAGVRGSF